MSQLPDGARQWALATYDPETGLPDCFTFMALRDDFEEAKRVALSMGWRMSEWLKPETTLLYWELQVQEVEEPVEIVEAMMKKVVNELGGFFWSQTPFVEMEDSGSKTTHNTFNNHLDALKAIASPDEKQPQVNPPMFEV